jgi:hypothetical protein
LSPDNLRRSNDEHPEYQYSPSPEFDDTLWPADADENHYRAMIDKVDLRSFGRAGELPPPTCREVVCNAMASVRSLEDLGEDIIISRSLGIDRYGRLCKIGRSDRDFRDVFCQFVAAIRQKLRDEMRRLAPPPDVREIIEEYARRLESFGKPDVHSPEKLLSFGLQSNNFGAVRRLYDEARNCLSAPDFGILDIRALHARCKPAEDEVEELIKLVGRVSDDLGEKGFSDRRDAMLEMRRSVGLATNSMERMFEGLDYLWHAAGLDPEKKKTLKEEIQRATKVVSDDETVDTLLSYILQLENELEAAIRRFTGVGST